MYLTYAAVCFLDVHSGISHLFAREMGANYSITSSKFLLFNLYQVPPNTPFYLCYILQNFAENIPKRGLSRLCSQTAPT